MSQYSRAAKETGHSFEFEPRSISKDFRASTRIKPHKKKKEKQYKSSSSLDETRGTELVGEFNHCYEYMYPMFSAFNVLVGSQSSSKHCHYQPWHGTSEQSSIGL